MEMQTISIENFNKLEPCLVQRNHEKRAKDKKTQEKLKILQEQHKLVIVAILTRDSYDPVTGITWPAGTVFLIDGHTRREYWNKYADTSQKPDSVNRVLFEVNDVAALRNLYYSFDNSTNIEKSADLAYGATRYLQYELTNLKLFQVMPITWASHFSKPQEFTVPAGFKGEDLINAYRLYQQELLFLDTIKWTTKYKIPGSLTCASLIFLKAYKLSEQSKTIVRSMYTNKFEGPDDEDRVSAITHVIEKLKDTGYDWAHNYNTMPVLVEEFAYWMNQSYEERKGKEFLSKYGGSRTKKCTIDSLCKKINV
jgi:hypothetical protein